MRSTVPLLAALALAPLTLAGQAPLTPADSARHVLDRLAYGATPGEIDAVARYGVMRWVDQQLGYDKTTDAALDNLKNTFDVLRMSNADLVREEARQLQLAKQLQSQNDSASRQAMLAQLKTQQRNGRKGLQRLLADLGTVTLDRAVESSHQLDEVLADFWLNHFNVYINKGQDRAFFPNYLDHTIRDNDLGSFYALLLATARSPAMLFYLDNAESVSPVTDQRVAALQAAARGRGGRLAGVRGRRAGVYPAARAGRGGAGLDSATLARARKNMPKGINENYARELMELHTLGVDGGYTQQDVIEVARGAHRLDHRPRGRGRSSSGPSRTTPPTRPSSAWTSRRDTARTRASGCCCCWPTTRPRCTMSAPNSARGSSRMNHRMAASMTRCMPGSRAMATSGASSLQSSIPRISGRRTTSTTR